MGDVMAMSGVHELAVVFGDFHKDVLEGRAFFLEGPHADAEADEAFHQIGLRVVVTGETEDHVLAGDPEIMNGGL